MEKKAITSYKRAPIDNVLLCEIYCHRRKVENSSWPVMNMMRNHTMIDSIVTPAHSEADYPLSKGKFHQISRGKIASMFMIRLNWYSGGPTSHRRNAKKYIAIFYAELAWVTWILLHCKILDLWSTGKNFFSIFPFFPLQSFLFFFPESTVIDFKTGKRKSENGTMAVENISVTPCEKVLPFNHPSREINFLACMARSTYRWILDQSPRTRGLTIKQNCQPTHPPPPPTYMKCMTKAKNCPVITFAVRNHRLGEFSTPQKTPQQKNVKFKRRQQ